jgi:hypothetical protein
MLYQTLDSGCTYLIILDMMYIATALVYLKLTIHIGLSHDHVT